MDITSFPVEYRPELIPRRGEVVAWGLALLMLVVWVGFTALGLVFPWPLRILSGLLVLAGMAISLSNWVDRQTILRLDEQGVIFKNGLRNVRLAWEDIRKVQVYPSNWGDKVYVVGKSSLFSFRTQHEVQLDGQVRGRMGFAEGEKIQRVIIQHSGLHRITQEGEGIYYGKE
jgi:hypothetical protein